MTTVIQLVFSLMNPCKGFGLIAGPSGSWSGTETGPSNQKYGVRGPPLVLKSLNPKTLRATKKRYKTP